MIRTAIVEDDPELRKLTASLLNFYDDIETVGAFASAEEFSAALPTLLPDVVLMDIGLPGKNGIDSVRELKPLYRNLQFVILTSNADPQRTFDALAVGATGYLLKSATPKKIAEAIR